MKHFKQLFLTLLLLLTLTACGDDKVTTYEISVNDEISTTYSVGDEIDFKAFFIIKDSNDKEITITDSMIDSSEVNMDLEGTYTLTISYYNMSEKVIITVNSLPVSYTIDFNKDKDTTIEIGSYVDFKEYFIITDSLGNNVDVSLSMLDYSNILLDTVGTYTLTISYEGNYLELELTVVDNTPIITYTIKVNESFDTTIELGSTVNFTEFFIITDSLGNNVSITDEMLNYSNVVLDTVGTYTLTISYEGNYLELELTVVDNTPIVTYTIIVNESIDTTIELGSTVDFSEYFIITDSLGNNVDVSLSMLDYSNVVLDTVGTYTLTISYEGNYLELELTVVDNTPIVTYTIKVNESIDTTIELGSTVDFSEYFIITDSLGNNVSITNGMLNLSAVDVNRVGSFIISISYLNESLELKITVIPKAEMYATDLFISEYSEGSNYNKYIEIFNGTGFDIDLSSYSLKLFNNSKLPAQYEFLLSGTLKDGNMLVVYNSNANSTIKGLGDLSDIVISFNGNDPIALYKDDVLIDIVGDINISVEDGFAIGSILNATKDNTIKRLSNVFGPNPNWTPNEWEVLGFEVYSDLKNHQMDNYTPPFVNPDIEVPDLYISEYFEGGGEYSNSKYIEIYNGLGYDVNLEDYALELYKDGIIEPSFTQKLSGILKHNDVYIVYAPYSSVEIKNVGDLASEVAYFNGRHAIALTKNSEVIDVFGVIGEYPPTNDGWFVDELRGTANNTLIRDYSVTSPSSVWIIEQWYVCGENYLYDIGQHNKTYTDDVIDDFNILFNLIKNLDLDSKGTATSSYQVTIKGTVYMDVVNETKLVYITDGENFIKLHGDYMHNYTSPNQVYEVVGNFKSYLYQPTFEVLLPSSDITRIDNEDPVTEITVKEVTLNEIVNLKKEDFVYNINNGYLQKMLHIKAYLQLDTHNSNKWDYALTENITYTKNDTQYINNALYFKNDVDQLEDVLMDYEVDLELENYEVDIFGVIYDHNPNRKNWRIYVDYELTFDYLSN